MTSRKVQQLFIEEFMGSIAHLVESLNNFYAGMAPEENANIQRAIRALGHANGFLSLVKKQIENAERGGGQ